VWPVVFFTEGWAKITTTCVVFLFIDCQLHVNLFSCSKAYLNIMKMAKHLNKCSGISKYGQKLAVAGCYFELCSSDTTVCEPVSDC